jgi:hypothetical protein
MKVEKGKDGTLVVMVEVEGTEGEKKEAVDALYKLAERTGGFGAMRGQYVEISAEGYKELTSAAGVAGFAETTRNFVAKEFAENGFVRPGYELLCKQQPPGIAILTPTEATAVGSMSHEIIRGIAAQREAFAAFYSFEMWIRFVADKDIEKERHIRPSTAPDRREAVALACDSPLLHPNRQMWIALIDRDADGKGILQPWELSMDGRLSWMTSMLPDYEATDGGVTA